MKIKKGKKEPAIDYQNQKELVKELNRLIGLDDEKNHIILYELEHNEKLKEKIRELVPEIRKYYRTANKIFNIC
jgi:hypothetical protein